MPAHGVIREGPRRAFGRKVTAGLIVPLNADNLPDFSVLHCDASLTVEHPYRTISVASDAFFALGTFP